MSSVGIIANPESGKDIRRLISEAVVVDNHQKTNVVRRLLLALEIMGVERVTVMPDYFGIGVRALDALAAGSHSLFAASLLDIPIDGCADDSLCAARRMHEDGAGCIVVLGGDGTCRVVARGCGDTPILPISTGTNNVVPYFVEGTAAGLAAGYVATHPDVPREELCWRHKRLEVRVNGEVVDQALVDVAVVSSFFVGARAVWDVGSLRQVFVTRAQPINTGLSSIVGMVSPVSATEPAGAAVTLSPGRRSVLAPLAPGLMKPVGIGDVVRMEPGRPYQIQADGDLPSILALDGEREVVLGPGDEADVTLRLDGPWLVDVEKTLRRAVAEGAFLRSK